MQTSSGFFSREKFFESIISISLVIVLGLSLIFISKLILKDVTGWIERPKTKSMITLNNFIKEKEHLDAQTLKVQKTLEVADRNYKSEIESYENLLKASKALGQPKENKKILAKFKKLENYRQQSSQHQITLDNLTKQGSALKKKIYDIRQLLHTEADKDEKYRKDLELYSVKIFIIRLLFLVPLFTIGIILIVAKRSTIYWPISWGLIGYSIYMFFWDVVPYIPDFGFYRYFRPAGSLLVSGFVIYLLLYKVRQTLQGKNNYLQLPVEERLKKIDAKKGFQSYHKHICPSCEKDFLYRKWNIHSLKNRKTMTESLAPDYCVYCGLKLFEECGHCGTRHYVYLPACPSCGTLKEYPKNK